MKSDHKRFVAILNEIDKDYNAYVGDVEVLCDSWEEADQIRKDMQWSGYYYILDALMIKSEDGNGYSKGIVSYKEWLKFKEEIE